MEGSFVSNNDRNSMITLFIIVYLICILCAIIPIIGIFGLPEKAKAVYFKIDKKSDNSQKDHAAVVKFDSLVNTLDSLLKAKELTSRYRTATTEMRTLSDNLKKSGNPYQSVFNTVANLFDRIETYCDNSAKADQLEKDLNILKIEKEQLTKDLQEANNKIQLKDVQIEKLSK